MRVLCTGVAGGIGRRVGTRLLEEGYDVIGVDRDARGLAELPPAIETHTVDLTDEQAVSESIASLDIETVVSCVGWYELGAIEDCSADALRAHLESNLVAVHNPISALLPTLRSGSGRIVVVGSMVGSVALPYHGAYSASKAGLASYVDALRREVEPRGVDISLVEPGPIRTGFNERAGEALERHTDSVYADVYRDFEGYSPESTNIDAVVDRIVHAVTSDSPKARYRVSSRARLLPWLEIVLPTRLYDRLVRSGLPGGLLHRLIDR